ncbi:MAG: hypothetical protein PW788_00855 [Micavibrio sp.]|nr:hypothetical protein [Micavibrio sp.]
MAQAQDVVEKVIKPWLEKNHPDADVVIMAGSYGRAMKQASWQPIASSDVDLVIIYRDLENGGFKAATQVFTMEEVGLKLGEDKERIMMIDTNIHDLASLHYHDKIVRENKSVAFINVMLDEGYLLRDRLGIGPILQEKAGEFLSEGPTPMIKLKWNSEIGLMATFLKDIKEAKSVEEKQFLGAMALIHVCDFGLHLQGAWPRFNQAYRVYDAKYPEEGTRITEAFSDLIRTGDSVKAEALLEDFIARGKVKMEAAPATAVDMLYPVEKHVPAEEVASINKMFSKFALEHYCEALETSQRRGELAHLSNLSATILGIKGAQETNDGSAPHFGAAGLRYLNDKVPNALPAVLDGLSEKQYDGVRKVAESVLTDMGGLHYSRLENYYLDDIARVKAMDAKLANENQKPAPKKVFTPKFNP